MDNIKVEISSNDLLHLRDQIAQKDIELNELHYKIRQLDENNIKSRIRSESLTLFDSYMNKVFKELGFNKQKQWVRPTEFECGFWREIGDKDWSDLENVHISIGVEILDEFRRAYLKIGVVTE